MSEMNKKEQETKRKKNEIKAKNLLDVTEHFYCFEMNH